MTRWLNSSATFWVNLRSELGPPGALRGSGPFLRALLVANGDDPHLSPAHLRDIDLVIAVDGGLDHLAAANLVPTVVVGDMDSVSAARLVTAEENGVEVVRHRADKSETDLELGIALAVRRGATELICCGVGGGRLDHQFANLAVLASPEFAAVRISAVEREFRAWVVHGTLRLPLAPGAALSVLAVGGPAVVSLTGTRWELNRHTLSPYVGLGVSNEVVGGEATVQVESGVVLAVSARA